LIDEANRYVNERENAKKKKELHDKKSLEEYLEKQHEAKKKDSPCFK
jgi:hypothetical protein